MCLYHLTRKSSKLQEVDFTFFLSFSLSLFITVFFIHLFIHIYIYFFISLFLSYHFLIIRRLSILRINKSLARKALYDKIYADIGGAATEESAEALRKEVHTSIL